MWRDVEGVDLKDSINKLATYHALFAVPFDTTAHVSACLPRHLFLDLSQRVLRNISCFRLRAHKLGTLGLPLYVTVVIVLRCKMRCMLS